MRHTRSNDCSPACCSSVAKASSGENKPLNTLPNATTQAPVNVAISITTAGLKRLIYVNVSQRTKRPSASVFKISTVWPLMVVTISPGRVALPEGIFSAAAIAPTT